MGASAAQTFERGVVRITQEGREATLPVEIARTHKARAQGLMGRERLGENAGMLFVYKGDARRFFWMKNTRIPLSLAFIDKSGEVLEIIHLQPHRPGTQIPSYTSRHKVRRVLEVNQGWFLRNGFGLGARVIAGVSGASGFRRLGRFLAQGQKRHDFRGEALHLLEHGMELEQE